MATIAPSHDRFRDFQSGADTPGPLVMINLLLYRGQADYAKDFDAALCSGRSACGRQWSV